MHPFPPSVVNEMAFNHALRTLESSPLGLSMTLFWHPESQKWECKFVDRDNFYCFSATHPQIAYAISDALEKVDNFGNESDYKYEDD